MLDLRSFLPRLAHLSYAPLLLPYRLTSERALIDSDIRRWNAEGDHDDFLGHLSQPEFRSLYYYRLRQGTVAARVVARLLRRVYKPEPTLVVACHSIGPGLFIQHGFCTLLGGTIGANCWILHGVTVGHVGHRAPDIGDNVMLGAGAKVIGGVRVGNGVRVGANAVVVKDVPDNHTVVAATVRSFDRGADLPDRVITSRPRPDRVPLHAAAS